MRTTLTQRVIRVTQKLTGYPLATAGVVFFVSFSLSVFAWWQVQTRVEDRNETRFKSQVADMEDNILDRLTLYEEALLAGQGFFLGSNSVERNEWKAFVQTLDIDENVPGMLGMGYVERIEQKTLSTSTEVRSKLDPNIAVPTEPGRSIYAPIVYVEPMNAYNTALVGYDTYSSNVRIAAMREADRTGLPRITGVLDLGAGRIQHISGFIIYLPIIKVSGTTAPETQGYVFGGFPFKDLAANLSSTAASIDLHIYDGGENEVDEAHLVYEQESGEDSKENQGSMFVPRYEQRRTVDIFGRTWTFTFHSTAEYEAGVQGNFLPLTILAEGCLVSILAGLAIYTMATRRAKAEAIANVMTSELALSKAEIEEKFKETERLNKFMIDRELRMAELKEELRRTRAGGQAQPS